MLKNAKEVGPCILVIDNAIENCENLIKKAKDLVDLNYFQDAKVENNDGHSVVDFKTRNAKIIDIAPVYKNEIVWWEVAQKIWKYGDAYGQKYDVSFSDMEHPQFLWYRKNEGFYSPHSDSGSGIIRAFSAVLYLNNLEKGGETYFEQFNVSVSPKPGRLVLFPANFAYCHGAKTPISDDKYAIVTWFRP
jgi:hypothetical protein